MPDGDAVKPTPAPVPAPTAKRTEHKLEASQATATDVSKMSVEELLNAIDQHDSSRAATTHSTLTLEEEEQYVRKSISLRKELSSLTTSGKLVPAQNISVPPGASRKLIVVMTPNGSTRPHVTTRAKRADSRIYIKLLDCDRSVLSNANADLADLPVRELIIRSSCVRSVLEVQQRSINFGTCEKGEVKSKTIVIHVSRLSSTLSSPWSTSLTRLQNKSDTVGLFRLRTSGSIASGDLKLGLGRYGLISAFGRKEVENFSFTPSLTGTYNENIVVENVLDGFNDQNVAVKANVRKPPTFTVEPAVVDFGIVDTTPVPSHVASSQNHTMGTLPNRNGSIEKMGFTLTNVSKHERTFVVEIKIPVGEDDRASSSTSTHSQDDSYRFVDLSLSSDEVGTALSKGEEEEIENILQKLKIARRKGKKDKIEKYESRLTELGVEIPMGAPSEASDTSKDGSVATEDGGNDKGDVTIKPGDASSSSSDSQTPRPIPINMDSESQASADPSSGPQTPTTEIDAPEYGPKHCVSSLTIVLQPNQKNRVLVELIPKSQSHLESDTTLVPLSSSSSSSSVTSTSSSHSQSNTRPHLHSNILETVLEIHDKRNADEIQSVKVIARRPGHYLSDAMTFHNPSSKTGSRTGYSTSSNTSHTSSTPIAALPLSDGMSLTLPEEQFEELL